MELVIAVAIVASLKCTVIFCNQSYIYCNILISYWPMQVLSLPKQNHFWAHSCAAVTVWEWHAANDRNQRNQV